MHESSGKALPVCGNSLLFERLLCFRAGELCVFFASEAFCVVENDAAKLSGAPMPEIVNESRIIAIFIVCMKLYSFPLQCDFGSASEYVLANNWLRIEQLCFNPLKPLRFSLGKSPEPSRMIACLLNLHAIA